MGQRSLVARRGPRSGALRSRLRHRFQRILRAAVPILQVTAAATSAWVIALQIGGHDDPFFAPIAAIVALSSPLGERGSQALRLRCALRGPSFDATSFCHVRRSSIEDLKAIVYVDD